MESRRVFDPQPGWEDGDLPRRWPLLPIIVGCLVILVAGAVVAALALLPRGERAPATSPQAARTTSPTTSPAPHTPEQPVPLLTGPVAEAVSGVECVQVRWNPPVYSCFGDTDTSTLVWTGDVDRPAALALTARRTNPEAWERDISAMAAVWGQDSTAQLRPLLTTTETRSLTTEWGWFTVVPDPSRNLVVVNGDRRGAPRSVAAPLPTQLTVDVVTRTAQAQGWSCVTAENSTQCTKGALTAMASGRRLVSFSVTGETVDSPDTWELLGALPDPGPDAVRAFQELPADRTMTALDGWGLSHRRGIVMVTQVAWG